MIQAFRIKLFAALMLFSTSFIQAQKPLQQYKNVNFSQVQITDHFWKPKLDNVARVTIPVCIEQTEVKTPRIRNFEKVARRQGEKHEGIYFDDSDVYKALEAMAYALKNKREAALEKKADEWINKIAAAQLPDGYLNTYYTLNGLDKRWTDMEKHEDYCAGHLIEAAVAYYNATGKRKLLDVAIRFADHIDSTFRLQNRPWVTGHQEIELALVKLYKTTSNQRYIQLSNWFLEQRGHGYGKGVIWDQWKAPEYCQDKVPVREQKEITGHAVRAMYLYTGAADVAATANDTAYMKAMKTVWEDVVYRNMYLTGGIGSSGSNEGFTTDYDLPNENAYCETCASVGMVFWNQRMGILTGESKYIDVLEKSLYNGALDGLSLSGDRFFYGNPLASVGRHFRREWFGTACCPSNIARLVQSLGDYVYGYNNNSIWVNLYVGSNTSIPISKQKVPLTVQTAYPWNGGINITLSPQQKATFSLRLRIPGWAQGEAVPGGLYQFEHTKTTKPSLKVNGKEVPYRLEKGYAVIEREWKKGDAITLQLPMEVQRVVSRPEVKANVDRVALQRGPLVYCVEGADNNGQAWNLILPQNAALSTTQYMVAAEPVVAIQAEVPVLNIAPDGTSVQTEKKKIIAIPYYTWANRGQGHMQVWLPEKIHEVKINH